MDLILLPEWTTGNIVLFAAIAVMALTMGLAVNLGILQMHYSKWRKAKGLPSRVGMLILYFGPIVAVTIGSWSYLSDATALQWVLFALVVLHFTKRCLEVLFLHRYSGPIDVLTVVHITAFYSGVCLLLGIWHERTVDGFDSLVIAGLVLYVIGQAGNFYHHLLLARLRDVNEGYFIPKGGFFECVDTPHYLFEIIAWIGVALCSRHLGAYLLVLLMIHYLAHRASRAHTWYLERFPDYPKSRKRLVPRLY